MLIKRLDVKEHHKVLEIGPGPGYFSTHVAKKLKRGRLVLLDIQQEMLDYSKKRLDKRKIANVEYKLGLSGYRVPRQVCASMLFPIRCR